MTDDHDVRRALASYADTAPYLDPRTGLRERIVRRAKVRRATIAGSACLAAVIAGTGIGVLSGDNGTTAVVASDPTDSPGAESPSPDPEASASTGPNGAPGNGSGETATPTPAWEPPAYPTEPIVRTAGGPNGLRVKVTFAPGSVATATTATLRVEAQDDDGQPAASSVAWGDGTNARMMGLVYDELCVRQSHGPTLLPTLSPSPSPTPRRKYAGTYDHEFEHAWRHPGRFTVTVVVSSVVTDCEAGEEERTAETETVDLDIQVLPGKVTSNGPAAPHVTADWDTVADEERTVSLQGGATDADGWPSSVVVDWGDGSKTERVTATGTCDDGDGRHYPQYGEATGELEHTYAKPGYYTVTLIGATTGCDGDSRQSGALSVDVVI